MNSTIYGNYSYGATAKKLTYSEPKVHSPAKENSTRKNSQKRAKAKFKIILFLFSAFLCFLSIIYCYAVITHLNYETDRLTAQYEKILNENQKLRIQIDNETDLTKVKQIAQEKYNMQDPDQHQIVYVRIPKNNFTKIATAYGYSSVAR